LRYKIEMEITIDPNGQITQDSIRFIPLLNWRHGNIISETGRITNSTFQYGLITYPASSQLPLAQGDKIRVKYMDIVLPVTISSVRGRISGLTRIVNDYRFRRNFNPGDTINLHYDPTTRLLEIT